MEVSISSPLHYYIELYHHRLTSNIITRFWEKEGERRREEGDIEWKGGQESRTEGYCLDETVGRGRSLRGHGRGHPAVQGGRRIEKWKEKREVQREAEAQLLKARPQACSWPLLPTSALTSSWHWWSTGAMAQVLVSQVRSAATGVDSWRTDGRTQIGPCQAGPTQFGFGSGYGLQVLP